MHKQQKIDTIYEKIANKELTFGCKVIIAGGVYHEAEGIFIDRRKFKTKKGIRNIKYAFDYCDRVMENTKIIGHPVMIGDVLDYLENIALDKVYNYIGIKKEEIPDLVFEKNKDLMKKIFSLWKNKRLPIEDQSDECIDFIYNLIS